MIKMEEFSGGLESYYPSNNLAMFDAPLLYVEEGEPNLEVSED